MQYAQLPGVLADRFFAFLDRDGDGYVNWPEFMSGMNSVYNSNVKEKISMVFQMYRHPANPQV